MRRAILLAGAALAFTSTFALAAPESLLPPSFDNPAPAPAPAPRPSAARPAPTAPTQRPAPAASGPAVAAPVVSPAPIPGAGLSVPVAPPTVASGVTLPSSFPSLRELEAMDPDEVDELLGLKPKFDIPPAARRSMSQVGVINAQEGGFSARSLAGQPEELVRKAMAGTRGPLVSRWGHMLLRRVLASRLDAPVGANPADFAAERAALLNRMGEAQVARALVQDVDSANYTLPLTNAAFASYFATGDILGLCPVMRLKATQRNDAQWEMLQAICLAHEGNASRSETQLRRAQRSGGAAGIDSLLAQRYAGAASQGRRAVTIEWGNVDELTPWRFGLARSLGVEIPAELRNAADPSFDLSDVLIPATPLQQRVTSSDRAGARGVLSASAMVDLYSQLWAAPEITGDLRERARLLRQAYTGNDSSARLSAMRSLWGDQPAYGRQVLTAYAAARVPVSEDLVDDAADLVASMLSAGLDRNALRWGSIVGEGSQGWALLALAQPQRNGSIGSGAFGSFVDSDDSEEQRKSRFLLAGLAGLGRLDDGAVSSYSSQLGVDLDRESVWSQRIDRAAELNNPALVALLAGVGMQGTGWDKMSARHLFHIVRALRMVGLEADARMIAAEAVARG